MAWWIYYLSVIFMVAGIRVSSLWNEKSRLWISGRKHWRKKFSTIPLPSAPRIWFHVSSLGEFEQARPVMEQLKTRHPDIDLILTFFSPSGYLIRSGYDKARVMYLPPDLPGNAQKWLDMIRPDVAVFVKYDIWPGYLKVLQEGKIPTVLISTHWLPGSGLRSWSIPPASQLLKKVNRIFFQKPEHLDYFRGKGFDNLQFAGDTRMDRSLELSAEAVSRIPEVLVASGPFDLIAGSTWKSDEDKLIPVIRRLKLKVIIAPHDVSEENIGRILRMSQVPVFRLSSMTKPVSGSCIVVVDRIGLLAYLYALGTVAFVGGGFGSGIHNTLEPMAHSKPVIFGPKYIRFPEAVDMVQAGYSMAVETEKQLEAALHYFLQPGRAAEAGAVAHAYLTRHAGASTLAVNYLEELIPFGPRYANPSGN